jgi:uncharacterized membrane protein
MSSTVTTPVSSSARIDPPSRLRPKYVFFAVLALVYAYVLWNNESFLLNKADPEWQHIASFKWWLLPHGLAAAFALFLGPLQFSDRLRQRYTKAHRIIGRLYVAGAVVGAPLGIYIQYKQESMGATHSFTLAAAFDAGIWLTCTTIAMVFILQGKVQQHRIWMTRSFACAIIFVEVRLIIGLFHLGPQYIETVVWGCVAVAVPLGDIALQIQESLRTRAARAKAPRPIPQTA